MIVASKGAAATAALVLLALLTWAPSAAAFTFSDGTDEPCTTGEGVVEERYHPADDPAAPSGFVGVTRFDPAAGWIIDWNVLMLSSAPDEAHDFIFFHECAHARARTFDELKANCRALIDMRADGRAGRRVEARLAAYHHRQGDMGAPYGKGDDFWAATVLCAARSAR